MGYKQFTSVLLFIGIIMLSLLNGCQHEEPDLADNLLYNLATNASGNTIFTYYKSRDSLLNTSSGSGHADPFFRTKYNQVAAQQLDSTGKVKAGATFADSSLIVKKLYDSDSELSVLAVLYKDYDNEFSDDHGWVWGYLNEDGSVREPASNKGAACVSCHSQQGNIDYTLMNKYFP